MDIRSAFLSSKAAESSVQGSNQTTTSVKRPLSRGQAIILESSSSKRKFVRTWLKDFPWLTYDVEVNQMFCKLCGDNTVEKIQLAVTHPPPLCLAVRTLKQNLWEATNLQLAILVVLRLLKLLRIHSWLVSHDLSLQWSSFLQCGEELTN